jgi:hypothetical protein
MPRTPDVFRPPPDGGVGHRRVFTSETPPAPPAAGLTWDEATQSWQETTTTWEDT